MIGALFLLSYFLAMDVREQRAQLRQQTQRQMLR
jgi:hypothetical protein